VKKTPLYDTHVKHGAKFGPFAGYEMPLFYKSGILTEHTHTRENAGLFDISHMMLVIISGNNVAQAISSLCPLNAADIANGDARYTFFLNDKAGIIDDLIVSRLADNRFLLVCNAGCAQKDLAHIEIQLSGRGLEINTLDYGLIAVQGPKSEAVLEAAGLSVSDLNFMQISEFGEGDKKCFASRCGYTGEDGYEIAMPERDIAEFTEKLISDERVLPVGLGARDSLRLEAGLSLYGQDLSDEITPMEAGLVWAIPKNLRSGGSYIGAKAIEDKISTGRKRKRVGLIPEGRAPVRAGAPIFDSSGNQVGEVTSGGFGPTVSHPIALGLIDIEADCDNLVAEVRGREIPLKIAKLPFVPHNYKR
jgi:aminomethyltransferase